MGRLVHRLSRVRQVWLKDTLIKGFCKLYGVDTSEAQKPVPSGYASFNAFFTRRLLVGLRPLPADPLAVVSPVDGTVQNAGRLSADKLLQAKGMDYSIAELLADSAAGDTFRDGWYLSVYLAPYNYHRVHVPVTGRLRQMRYVPGERWAVNSATVATLPGIFAENERVVIELDASFGVYCAVMVGAMNVASISTPWHGEVCPATGHSARRWRYPGKAGAALTRGDELGQFNLGSTVIVLFPAQGLELNALSPGDRLRMGQRVGTLAKA